MSRWTDEELRELVTLWPTKSAPQIAERLHRQHAAICRKAMLLGLLSPYLSKHFYVNLRKPRSRLRPKHGQAAATRRRQRVLTSSLNGCYPMLDLAQVRTLLLAERSRDVGVITEAVDAVLATSPKRARSISKWRSAMPARLSI